MLQQNKHLLFKAQAKLLPSFVTVKRGHFFQKQYTTTTFDSSSFLHHIMPVQDLLFALKETHVIEPVKERGPTMEGFLQQLMGHEKLSLEHVQQATEHAAPYFETSPKLLHVLLTRGYSRFAYPYTILRQSGVYRNPHTLNKMLLECLQRQGPVVACEWVRQTRLKFPTSRIDEYTYKQILTRLIKEIGFNEARKYTQNWCISKSLLNVLMEEWLKMGEVEHAASLYEQTRARGSVDAVGTTIMVDIYTSNGRFDDAYALMGKIQTLHAIPSHFYELVLKAKNIQYEQIIQQGDAESITFYMFYLLRKEQILNGDDSKLVQLYFALDKLNANQHYTYGVIVLRKLLNQLKNKAFIMQAVPLYRYLLDKYEVEAKRDVATFNKILFAMSKNRLFSDMESIISSPSIPPIDDTGYNYLIMGYVESGEITRARDIQKSFLAKYKPTTNTFAPIIYHHNRNGKHEKANNAAVVEQYELMQKHNVIPNSVMATTILEAYVRLGHITKARKLLHDLSHIPNFHPTTAIYNTILKTILLTDVNKGIEFIKVIPHPTAVTGVILLNGMNAKGLPSREVKSWFDFFCHKFAATVEMCTTMIRCYAQHDEWREALQLFKEMSTKYKVTPNAHAYSCMIASCWKNKQMKEAEDLYNEMITMKIPSNDAVHMARLRGLHRMQGHAAAKAFVHELKQKNVTFDTKLQVYIKQNALG